MRDGAAEARYHEMDGDGKRKFLEEFAKNRKDLSWFRAFTHEKTISDQKTTTVREGWLNGSQILATPKLSPDLFQTTEARQTVIQEMIEQSEAEFLYTNEKAAHKNDLLSKYFFKFVIGVDTTHTESDTLRTTNTVSGDASKFESQTSRALIQSGAPGSSTDIVKKRVV